MAGGDKWKDSQKEWYNDNRASCSLDLVDKNNQTHLARLKELIPKIPEGAKRLEVGCGEGWYSQQFDNTIGFDISFESVKEAKKTGMKVVVADAENLPFRDETFSHVYGFAILHHLADIEKGFGEMNRTLKPGGCITFGSENSSACPMNYIFPLLYRNWNIEKGFMRISPKNLKKMLGSTGFAEFNYDIAGFAVYGINNTVYQITKAVEGIISKSSLIRRFAGFIYFSARKP
jgi:ubiquinone/menaquinone biosynthesis C-methylase UbiE